MKQRLLLQKFPLCRLCPQLKKPQCCGYDRRRRHLLRQRHMEAAPGERRSRHNKRRTAQRSGNVCKYRRRSVNYTAGRYFQRSAVFRSKRGIKGTVQGVSGITIIFLTQSSENRVRKTGSRPAPCFLFQAGKSRPPFARLFSFCPAACYNLKKSPWR